MTPAQIRALRIKLALTQKKFADRIGVSLNSLNKWENGHVTPSYLAMDSLEQVAKSIDKPKE